MVSANMAGGHLYQVFRACTVPGAPTLPGWTWQRVDRAGAPLARGALYGSLPECFAALRRNRERLGMAPVRIDLAGASTADATDVVAVSLGERDVTITSNEAPGRTSQPRTPESR